MKDASVILVGEKNVLKRGVEKKETCISCPISFLCKFCSFLDDEIKRHVIRTFVSFHTQQSVMAPVQKQQKLCSV
jgi:hypothetical protein